MTPFSGAQQESGVTNVWDVPVGSNVVHRRVPIIAVHRKVPPKAFTVAGRRSPKGKSLFSSEMSAEARLLTPRAVLLESSCWLCSAVLPSVDAARTAGMAEIMAEAVVGLAAPAAEIIAETAKSFVQALDRTM